MIQNSQFTRFQNPILLLLVCPMPILYHPHGAMPIFLATSTFIPFKWVMSFFD